MSESGSGPAHPGDEPAASDAGAAPLAEPARGRADSPEARALGEVLAVWLEKATEPAAPPESAEQVGLVQLVEAFTALRQDVKLQTKTARQVSEQAASATEALRQATERFDALSQRMASRQAEATETQRLARPLAKALAEMDEAVARVGLELARARQRVIEHAGTHLADRLGETLDQHQPRWLRWLTGPAQRRPLRQACAEQAERTLGPLLQSLEQGYELMQQRLESTLQQQGIRRVPCVGRQADPQTMCVIGTIASTEHAHGQVIEEVRPGYFWGEQVLRTAEVRAAGDTPPAASPTQTGGLQP